MKKPRLDASQSVLSGPRSSSARHPSAGSGLGAPLDAFPEEQMFANVDFIGALLDIVGVLVVIVDPEGRIVHFNKMCEAVTGFAPDEVKGLHFWVKLLLAEETPGAQAVFSRLLSGDFPNRHETHLLTKSGGRRLIEWSNTSVTKPDGSVLYVIGTGIDVTDRRRAQGEIEHSRRMLRQLHARLISAQEEANRRLARELHDGIAQALAVVAIELNSLEDDQLTARDRSRRMKRLREQIQILNQDIHNLSRDLHPAYLQMLGLKAALKKECQDFADRWGIHMECLIEGLPEPLPEAIGITLYRIAQEGLQNIAKHAHASSVWICVMRQDGGLLMSIRDDGQGFDVARARATGGLGLISMEERARMVDGRLTVGSRTNQGSTIEVRIPIEGSVS